MRRRRGTTLMETIALMGGVAVLLAVAITSIQALMSVERSNRREAAIDLRIDSLAEIFRKDVHISKNQNLAVNADQTTLTLDLGGRQAIYATTPKGVQVTHQPGGEAPARVERFTLPGCRVAMEEVPAEAETPSRIRMTIHREGIRSDDPALWIEAVPGREVSR